MIQAMKSQNLLQKNGMSQTVKQQKVNTSKAILLNLKQKLLNQVFVIILMHLFQLHEILQQLQTMNDTDVAFKNCAPFSTCTTKINDMFVDKANHFTLQCICTI